MGSISDGSPHMVGAKRVIVNVSGGELLETVTQWDASQKMYVMSIDKGAPPFAKKMSLGFQVREITTNGGAYVDMTADIELKLIFVLLTPLIKAALPKKLKAFAAGFTVLQG